MKKILRTWLLMMKYFQGMLVEQEDNEHNIDKDNNTTKPKLHTIPKGSSQP
jgi:hypothetical protein